MDVYPDLQYLFKNKIEMALIVRLCVYVLAELESVSDYYFFLVPSWPLAELLFNIKRYNTIYT